MFDPAGGGAYDVLAFDVNGDSTKDVVTHGNTRPTWYRLPGFEKHDIAPGTPDGVSSTGAGDVDEDGDV